MKVLMVERLCCMVLVLPNMVPSGDVMCWYTLLINSKVRRLSFLGISMHRPINYFF